MALYPTATISVRPPVVFTGRLLPDSTTLVPKFRHIPHSRWVIETKQNASAKTSVNKTGIVTVTIVGVVVLIIIIILFIWVFLSWYRAHEALKAKKTKGLDDQQQRLSFVRRSSQQLTRPYQEDPVILLKHDYADPEKALRNIGRTSRPVSDLPLRNSHASPDSSPAVANEVEVPLDLEKLSRAKPLIFKGVPRRYRYRTTKVNDWNSDGTFVNIEDERMPLFRPSGEGIMRHIPNNFSYSGKRTSVGTDVTHITTGASVVEAVSVNLCSVFPDIVDVALPNATIKAAPEPPIFVIGDGDDTDVEEGPVSI